MGLGRLWSISENLRTHCSPGTSGQNSCIYEIYESSDMKNSLDVESVAQQIPYVIILMLAKIILALSTAAAMRSSLLT